MRNIYFILFWIAVGIGVYWLIQKVSRRSADDFSGNPINPEQIKKRQENLAKILSLAQSQSRISNNDVEKALGVSDATATRYLEYLVNLGRLSRYGERGQTVFYQITP